MLPRARRPWVSLSGAGPKIIDFGIASQVAAGQDTTVQGLGASRFREWSTLRPAGSRRENVPAGAHSR